MLKTKPEKDPPLVNANQSSFLRDVAGFMAGGLVASLASSLVFLAFFPLPSVPNPRNHTGEALVILALVMFFSGGLIGRGAFKAEFWSDLLLPVIGSLVASVALCLIAGLDFRETATMIGFAAVGIVSSAVALLLLRHCFIDRRKQ